MKRLLLLILLVLANTVPAADAPGWTEEFQIAESRWRSEKILNYRLAVKVSCIFCPGGLPKSGMIRATIADGVPIEIEGASVGELSLQDYASIDGLFNLIRWWTRNEADTVELSFDKDLGFPKSIYVDPDSNATDDSLIVEVQSFEVNR